MNKKYLLSIICFLFVSISMFSQSPQAFKYQSVVRDAQGNALANQNVSFKISILQSTSTGSSVYSETQNVTTNAFGLANLSIGSGVVVSGNFSSIAWESDNFFIQTELDISGATGYILMGSTQLLSVPYALHSKTVELDNDMQTLTYDSLNGNLTISNGNTVYISSSSSGGNDNWGTQVVLSDSSLSGDGTSSAPLTVVGDLTDDQNLTSATLIGTNLTVNIENGNSANVDLSTLVDDADNDPNNEIELPSTGALNDVLTWNGTAWAAQVNDGVDDADNDPNNEIELPTTAGISDVLTWTGTSWVGQPNSVVSNNTLDMAYDEGASGAGRIITVDAGEVELNNSTVMGIALRTTTNNTGVAIVANSTNSANTFSTIQGSTNAASTNASAIIGNSDGAAWGITGQVSALATGTAGVYGSNLRSNGGHGVYGIGVNGVVGFTQYQSGFGVYGENSDAIGSNTANSIGTYGRGYIGVWGDVNTSPVGAYAVYANGDFGGSGAKYFVIDHPKDPENKYLKHACVESNEILNVYRGNSTFNANGEAIVILPDYFEDINIDYSYHLTPIGSFSPLYVKSKIKDGQFIIAGGKLGMEVSWSVYAQRNDPYLQKYPEKRNVEIDKESWNKGKYLMPDLYNQSDDKRIVKPLSLKEQKEIDLMK